MLTAAGPPARLSTRLVAVGLVLAALSAGCARSPETSAVATIGGSPTTTQPVAETTTTTEATTVTSPTPTETSSTTNDPPDLDDGLASVGYGDRSGAPEVACAGALNGWSPRQVVNTDDFLNIRSTPSGEVIMRMAPGFEFLALTDGTAADAGAASLPQIHEGSPWLLVRLPGAADAEASCGWVHGSFVSSPTAANFSIEYLDAGATDEVLSQREVSELADQGWTTPTGSYPCHGTETLGSVRTVIAPDFLNVRIGPGVSNERVTRLAPGLPVYAYTGFASDNGRPFTVTDVGQSPWIMIDIPYEGDAGEPAPSGCGWVSTRFLSSDSAAHLADEIKGQS